MNPFLFFLVMIKKQEVGWESAKGNSYPHPHLNRAGVDRENYEEDCEDGED